MGLGKEHGGILAWEALLVYDRSWCNRCYFMASLQSPCPQHTVSPVIFRHFLMDSTDDTLCFTRKQSRSMAFPPT